MRKYFEETPKNNEQLDAETKELMQKYLDNKSNYISGNNFQQLILDLHERWRHFHHNSNSWHKNVMRKTTEEDTP